MCTRGPTKVSRSGTAPTIGSTAIYTSSCRPRTAVLARARIPGTSGRRGSGNNAAVVQSLCSSSFVRSESTARRPFASLRRARTAARHDGDERRCCSLGNAHQAPTDGGDEEEGSGEEAVAWRRHVERASAGSLAALREAEAAQLPSVALGLGCFWGAEETLRQVPGVKATRTGYVTGCEGTSGSGAAASEAVTYEDVCSGNGMTEAVRVWYAPREVSFAELLGHFWAATGARAVKARRKVQYRSGVWTTSSDQMSLAHASVGAEAQRREQPVSDIVTIIAPLAHWHEAEERHQRYKLKKQPRTQANRASADKWLQRWQAKQSQPSNDESACDASTSN